MPIRFGGNIAAGWGAVVNAALSEVMNGRRYLKGDQQASTGILPQINLRHLSLASVAP